MIGFILTHRTTGWITVRVMTLPYQPSGITVPDLPKGETK